MEEIRLLRCVNTGGGEGTLAFDFAYSAGLAPYFRGTTLRCAFGEALDGVPEAVLCTLFAANFLPFVWLFDAALILPALDADFYDALPNILAGYRKLYPALHAGKIVCAQIERVRPAQSAVSSALFFSGGLDSIQTLLAHRSEQPDLLTLWGADIAYANAAAWQTLSAQLGAVAEGEGLKRRIIHTNFRDLEDEGALSRPAHSLLGDNWWHGLKHAMALFGHTAPLIWKYGYTKLYIASSNPQTRAEAKCASNPYADNAVRLCGCQVVHDGFAFNRQAKAANVVEICTKRGRPIPLHVCWRSKDGRNCCACEKCFRTIAALLAEGGEPEHFGFGGYRRTFTLARVAETIGKLLHAGGAGQDNLLHEWREIASRLEAQRAQWRAHPSARVLDWIARSESIRSGKAIKPAWPLYVAIQCNRLKRCLSKPFKR